MLIEKMIQVGIHPPPRVRLFDCANVCMPFMSLDAVAPDVSVITSPFPELWMESRANIGGPEPAGGACHVGSPLPSMEERREELSGMKWDTTWRLFLGDGIPHPERGYLGADPIRILVPESGECGESLRERNDLDDSDVVIRSSFERYLRAFLFAVSLMHCRNVRQVERAPSGKAKRGARRRGEREPLTYHVLEIDPMRSPLLDRKGETSGR